MKDRVAVALALLLPGALVIPIFMALHDWGSTAFAKPALASALLTVVETAVLLAAVAVAPALAALLRRLLR